MRYTITGGEGVGTVTEVRSAVARTHPHISNFDNSPHVAIAADTGGRVFAAVDEIVPEETEPTVRT
ncbi:hypothetical protein MKOR_12310 [Mycolicibacillus koreensis]|nr:hypothetical protein MKOR_12310 [Mycolicibacillus koreensis]